MQNIKTIAICGDIGAGKSVVCRVLECKGYTVYDCDSCAKAIMDADVEIKRRIVEDVCADALDSDMCLRRDRIAAVVFGDAEALRRLNAIVHGAVLNDILGIKEKISHGEIPAKQGILFIETAILYQSGLDKLVDEVWEVTAAEDIRIARVCRRNGITPEQAQARIDSQRYTPANPHPVVRHIDNSGTKSLLLQIAKLL